MRHTDQRGTLRVNIETKQCDLPRDELPRINEPINRIAQIVGDVPGQLDITIVHHPRSQRFHVREQLKLPRRSVFTGEWSDYLDTALCRSLSKLIHKAEAYKQEPDHGRDDRVERVEKMNRDVVAPEDPDMSQLAAAVDEGDYSAFHALLSGHEDWLRLRVGRWLQRYPDAEAEVGRRVKIGDLVEEVLLNAFEGFHERSADVPMRDWLNSLIDPSLLDYCRHPAEERENISFVRSLRAPPRTDNGTAETVTNGKPLRRQAVAKKAARPAATRRRPSKKTKATTTKKRKTPTAKKTTKSRRRPKAATAKKTASAKVRKKAPRAKKSGKTRRSR